MISRREFLKLSGAGVLSLFAASRGKFALRAQAAIPGGTLDPLAVPKFVTPLLIPPAMPRAGKVKVKGGKQIDYYEIAMRQFQQQILPAGLPATTVWGYGPRVAQNGPAIFNAPSLTIEAKVNTPVRIKWINELVDANGDYLPHLLPVDPTLHWANPPQTPNEMGQAGPDRRPHFMDGMPGRYTGPVPIVSHVHGAVGVGDDSDGYAEAWYLPAAGNIPAGYATEGTWYQFFKGKAQNSYGAAWGAGFAIFQYPNHNRASTIWYHDHTLGMTRLNVYAGPAGFFIIRGGPSDLVLDSRSGLAAVLPGPAPALGDLPGTMYYEIPIAIQDRAFNGDGSLFYPDSRTFFDGIAGPYIGEMNGGEMHGAFSPIWNPEFFGNTMMVNGNTWPFLNVEQRQYRFRFLNGCDSRFLILDFATLINAGAEVWQIGNEGGFLAAPVNIKALGGQLLLGLAERADMIVDFTNVPVGNYVLGNAGPDEPFGGGVPGSDFPVADPLTTGQIMQFNVVGPALTPDLSTPPQFLQLPAIVPLPAETVVRPLALIEKMGMGQDADGIMVDGPVEAVLGTVEGGYAVEKMWMEPVTENPAVGTTEVWEFYNTTGDAHPMHVHEVVFEVVNREGLVPDENGDPVQPFQLDGNLMPPQPWETGVKDTVTAYPGQVTRVRAQFNHPGQFVWHCHIVSHEDNEMMRPFRIGPVQPGQPA